MLDKTFNPADVEKRLKAIQLLLEPHCLLLVHINPESRVKAARGPLEASLVRGRAAFVLVKVHNEAGVTAPWRNDRRPCGDGHGQGPSACRC